LFTARVIGTSGSLGLVYAEIFFCLRTGGILILAPHMVARLGQIGWLFQTRFFAVLARATTTSPG